MVICPLCEETELSKNAKLPTCRNCRGSIGSWARRSAAEILNRRRKLHIYDLRMETLVAHPAAPTKAAPVLKPFVSTAKLRKEIRQRKGGNGQGVRA